MAIVTDAWDLAVLFAPLVYIAILGRRDEPAQRLVAFMQTFAELVEAVDAIIRRRPRQ